jgi:ABC-type branched-subunit amino acid transport system ATPase component
MSELYCEGLTKTYGATRALYDVTLRLPSAGCVGVIGANGAGKTTLINVISGFNKPDAGRCFYDGRMISGLAPHKIVQAGIVRSFQDLRLISALSALDNVLLSHQNRRGESLLYAVTHIGVSAQERRNRDSALDLLRLVELESEVEKPARELSYGQQKLLSLACCLATNARVLLLDEPVSGVDPAIALKVLDFLADLKEQGRLLVIIEHDLRAVRHVADTVALMERGQVIAYGSSADVLDRPGTLESYVT